MKTTSLILTASLLLSGALFGDAAVIARWTFETSPPGPVNNSTTFGPISADEGMGTASGVHTSGGTDWIAQVGNGSATSMSANMWNVGDYFQFRVSTVGWSDIRLSWDQTSSSDGPRHFVLQYSTDGTTFTQFGSQYTVQQNLFPNSWNASTHLSAYSHSVDLSSVTAVNNAPDVYFRLVDNSTTSADGNIVGPGGTTRIDNFTVVPEAHHYALFCALGLIGIAAGKEIRRRQGTSDR